MKNELKEAVVLKCSNEEFRHVARLGKDGETIIIEHSFLEPNGKWIDGGSTIAIWGFSDIVKIYEAWGKKKEVTEKDVQMLLFGLHAIEENTVMGKYITKSQANFIINSNFIIDWLSKLGIKVKPEGGKE